MSTDKEAVLVNTFALGMQMAKSEEKLILHSQYRDTYLHYQDNKDKDEDLKKAFETGFELGKK